jgi:large subunit ribosomal protein L17
MRHQMAHRKLGRTSAHRNALFRNQLSSMIDKERIVTTLPKAKELRPILEKMVTMAKQDSVHTRRQAARVISDGELVTKLFEKVSPRFAERPGGYTRIIKLGPRRGDGAEMAILEFVDYKLPSEPAGAPKGGKRQKAAPASAETEGEAAEAKSREEKPKPKKPAKKAAAPKKGSEKKPKPKAEKKESKPRKSTKKK